MHNVTAKGQSTITERNEDCKSLTND